MRGDGGEVIASQLREIGIELEIIPVEWADWLKQVFTDKDYDLTIVSHTEPNDIDIYSRKDYYFNYDNPAFDKIIDELEPDLRRGQAQRALQAGAEDPRRRRGERLPVRTAEDRRLGRQARRPVGERADPGQRPDQGEVGGVTSQARRLDLAWGSAHRQPAGAADVSGDVRQAGCASGIGESAPP